MGRIGKGGSEETPPPFENYECLHLSFQFVISIYNYSQLPSVRNKNIDKLTQEQKGLYNYEQAIQTQQQAHGHPGTRTSKTFLKV